LVLNLRLCLAQIVAHNGKLGLELTDPALPKRHLVLAGCAPPAGSVVGAHRRFLFLS
jgi:hypothetical protein